MEKLKSWRKTNNLSQRQAVAVMESSGLEVPLLTLQKWEGGFRSPGRFALSALDQFLEQHPTVTDAPVYGRWKTTMPDSKVSEMRKLRANGMSLLSLAERFGISESSVSRICRGERRAK